jgi:ubiquitin-protein ligase
VSAKGKLGSGIAMAHYQVYFDTLEGERKYNVDISDDEPIEQVLREILGELSERGHMMKGLATGDLKVVWGGASGRELDLSRTLPEQGVKPNDVLRVLVEMYEGGGLRSDRIEREWKLLGRLARANPSRVEVLDRQSVASEETFRVKLHESPGLSHASGERLYRRDSHTVSLRFPRFYPDVPIECYVEERLFHPNVNQQTGFVCLWEDANPRDTAIQALARAQAMAAYRMLNLGGPHQMNREAADWYQSVGKPRALVPLTWDELRVYEVEDGQMVWLEPGRSLASASTRRLL